MRKQVKQITIVGIDFSLNSPAICVSDVSLKFEDCKFFYLTSKKKHIGNMMKNILGTEHTEYKNPIERFANLSTWALSIINKLTEPKIFIEGYSYGSKGQAVFQIAENGGILKYRLSQYDYRILVPSVIKKFATGKGNADKQKMYEQFTKDTNTNLMKAFDIPTLNNPITDIVDAYYITKKGYYESRMCGT
jgi:Holliday junction resolvasome RuvABC endonuclease subunit